jgi:hypothetical protein
MPKPIEIQGREYFVNVAKVTGSTESGQVEIVIELFDQEPSWLNGVPSVQPAHTIRCHGDAGTLYYQLHGTEEVLNLARSW